MPTIAIGSAVAAGRAFDSFCSSNCRWAGDNRAIRAARSLMEAGAESPPNSLAAGQFLCDLSKPSKIFYWAR
jgi:hypothetical protein